MLAIGTGSGRLSEDILKRFGDKVTVVDTDYEPQCAVRSYWARVVKGAPYLRRVSEQPLNAANMRIWPDETFDLVVAFGCLRYFGDTLSNQVAKEINRVLRTDGLALLGEAVQRYSRPGLLARFKNKLEENTGIATKQLDEDNVTVFRCTTFYNILHQCEAMIFPEFTRDYVLLLRKIVNIKLHGKGRIDKEVLYDVYADLVGVKHGYVSLILASKNAVTLPSIIHKELPHLSRGLLPEDQEPVRAATQAALSHSQKPDTRMQAVLKQAREYFVTRGQGNLASILKDNEFRFVMPDSDIHSQAPPLYLWYHSQNRFLLATTYRNKALIPYALIEYLLTRQAPVSLIPRILLHEARHLHNGFKTANEHDLDAREIMEEVTKCLSKHDVTKNPAASSRVVTAKGRLSRVDNYIGYRHRISSLYNNGIGSEVA